jgi:antitoxin ParD1/3/4
MSVGNVSVPKELESFIASAIAEGRYSSATEAVSEGLRLLQQRDLEDSAKIEWLRSAAQVGIDAIERGDYVTLTSPQEIRNHLRGLRIAR